MLKSLTGPATYTGIKICLLVISLGLRLKSLINGMSVHPYYRINFGKTLFLDIKWSKSVAELILYKQNPLVVIFQQNLWCLGAQRPSENGPFLRKSSNSVVLLRVYRDI